MQSYDILAYGLTDWEIERLKHLTPPDSTLYATDCATDLIATAASGMWYISAGFHRMI